MLRIDVVAPEIFIFAVVPVDEFEIEQDVWVADAVERISNGAFKLGIHIDKVAAFEILENLA